MLNINIQLHLNVFSICGWSSILFLYTPMKVTLGQKKIGMFRAPRPTLAKPPHDPNFFFISKKMNILDEKKSIRK